MCTDPLLCRRSVTIPKLLRWLHHCYWCSVIIFSAAASSLLLLRRHHCCCCRDIIVAARSDPTLSVNALGRFSHHISCHCAGAILPHLLSLSWGVTSTTLAVTAQGQYSHICCHCAGALLPPHLLSLRWDITLTFVVTPPRRQASFSHSSWRVKKKKKEEKRNEKKEKRKKKREKRKPGLAFEFFSYNPRAIYHREVSMKKVRSFQLWTSK